jgi:hypothetical protein
MIQGGAFTKTKMIISLLVVIGMVLIGTFGYVLFGNSGSAPPAPPAPPAPVSPPAPPAPPPPFPTPTLAPADYYQWRPLYDKSSYMPYCFESNDTGLTLEYCDIDNSNQFFKYANNGNIKLVNGKCLSPGKYNTIDQNPCDTTPLFSWHKSSNKLISSTGQCMSIHTNQNPGAMIVLDDIDNKHCLIQPPPEDPYLYPVIPTPPPGYNKWEDLYNNDICLDASDNVVRFKHCNHIIPYQYFKVNDNNTITVLGNKLCLTVDSTNRIVQESCDSSSGSQLWDRSSGDIIHRGTGQCLATQVDANKIIDSTFVGLDNPGSDKCVKPVFTPNP